MQHKLTFYVNVARSFFLTFPLHITFI